MFGARIIGKIEPTAHVGPNVKMGVNNYVGHGVVIEGNVVIGDNNYIGHHCVIGVPAQNNVYRYEIDDEHECANAVFIGSNNVLREFTTVHRPMDSETRIGSYCYLMAYNHVSHDSQLSDRVILANNCQIGGYTHIHSFANVGLSTAIHQHSTIGAHAMIGMSATISRDVPPFAVAMGNPIEWSGKVNAIGLQRNGYSEADVARIASLYGKDTPSYDLAHIPASIRIHLEAFKQQSHRKRLSINAALDEFLAPSKP
jgi:UDP-N-acetylglucosamine acyltransferase